MGRNYQLYLYTRKKKILIVCIKDANGPFGALLLLRKTLYHEVILIFGSNGQQMQCHIYTRFKTVRVKCHGEGPILVTSQEIVIS